MPNLSPSGMIWVVAIAAFSLGGLSCFVLVHINGRRQFDATRIHRDLDRREDIYSQFIAQASEMVLESFETPNDPANLIGLAALVGRIRLSSTRPVLEAAEALVDFLLDTSQRKPADARRLVSEAPREFIEPLRAFTSACRSEREELLRGL